MKKLPPAARALLHAVNIEACCSIIFYSAGAGRYVPDDQTGELLLALAALLHAPGLIISSAAALPLSMLWAEYVTSWLWLINVAVCNTAFVGWLINAQGACGAGRRMTVR